MTMFHAGQRVRVAHLPRMIAAVFPRLDGADGVVNSVDCLNQLGEPGRIGVTIDGHTGLCFKPEWLEPITFPGAPADIVAAELDKHRVREVAV